jgi:hypothetical protein
MSARWGGSRLGGQRRFRCPRRAACPCSSAGVPLLLPVSTSTTARGEQWRSLVPSVNRAGGACMRYCPSLVCGPHTIDPKSGYSNPVPSSASIEGHWPVDPIFFYAALLHHPMYQHMTPGQKRISFLSCTEINRIYRLDTSKHKK